MNDTPFMNVEVRDFLFKAQLYLHKIVGTNGSLAQIQKICHLAVQTYFTQELYSKIIALIKQTKNYFLLYLLDLLIKNSRCMMKIAKKDLQFLFKHVWQNLWQQSKNQSRLECMKAMAKTWGIIYGEAIEEPLKMWLLDKYKVSLFLQKYEDIYNQIVQKNRITRNKYIIKGENELSISDSDKKSTNRYGEDVKKEIKNHLI